MICPEVTLRSLISLAGAATSIIFVATNNNNGNLQSAYPAAQSATTESMLAATKMRLVAAPDNDSLTGR